MKQLPGLDASFLHLETPQTPMHVGAMMTFKLPKGAPPDFVRKLMLLMREKPFMPQPFGSRLKRGRLAKLAQSPAGEMSTMSLQVPNPDTWDLAHLCETPEGEPSAPALRNLLDALSECAFTVSEDISTTYFTHSGHTKQSVGT